MAWTVDLSPNALRDLSLLFDHFDATYQSLGDSPDDAAEHAAERLLQIRDAMAKLTTSPFIGTHHPDLDEDLGPQIRHVTKNRAIIWFKLLEKKECIQVLGVFFGSQDHIRHMYARLLEGD